MSSTVKVPCDVIPTHTYFSPTWLAERTTTDEHGTPVKVGEECGWVFNPGSNRWQLMITRPNSRYPFSQDFKDGDQIEVRSPDGRTIDKGSITLHKGQQPMPGGGFVPVYTYTSENMMELTT